MKKYCELLRVKHYVKNMLVFATLVCGGKIFEYDRLILNVLGFVAFCLISSIVYIINDIVDVEKDRKHYRKKNRPIASGKISINKAVCIIGLIIILVILVCIMLDNARANIVLLVYLIINLIYSVCGAKNIPLLDICILVLGFLLRVIYGSIIINIQISNWLYLTVIALSFYLAFGKRRNELKFIEENNRRSVLKYYTISFLDKNMYMCLALTNVFYALWTVDEKTIAVHGNNYLVWTVPLIIIIIMKYSMDVEGDSEGDPTEVLLSDKVFMVLCIVYCIIMFVLLYVV